jgi:hypothetical protein
MLGSVILAKSNIIKSLNFFKLTTGAGEILLLVLMSLID